MKKNPNVLKKARERLDSWMNALSGIGIRGKDRRLETAIRDDFAPLDRDEAEAIYSGDFMAAKMVDTLAEDMVREGFTLTIPNMDEAEIRKIEEYLEANLHWKARFQQALSWARLYGGSALLLGVDDGMTDLAKPLEWSKIKRFDFMTVLHRWELAADDIEGDPAKENYGLPKTYLFRPTIGGRELADVNSFKKIHASRLIRFDGSPLPREEFRANGYWHDSILTKRSQALADYDHSYGATATLMGDVSQAVWQIENLHEILTGSDDGKSLLLQRIDMLDYSRSVLNALLLAKEETYERKTTNLTGIPEILRKLEERLVACSEYPHTILLGEAPGSSLGDTGKSELRDYYDAVSKKQEVFVKPGLRILLKAMFLNKNGPTKGVEPESWDLKFKPLWQDSQKEILEQRGTQSEIDERYIRSGVISADEVARSRFGSGQFSFETTLTYDRSEEPDDVTSDDQDRDEQDQNPEDDLPPNIDDDIIFS